MKLTRPSYPERPRNVEDEFAMCLYWDTCFKLAKEADDTNRIAYKEYEEKRLEFRAMAYQFFGGSSSQVKYLDKQLKKLPNSPIWYVMNLESNKHSWKENLDKKKRDLEEQKRKSEQDEKAVALNVRAALWLSNKGIDDFDPIHALERANEVAAEQELLCLETGKGMHSFDGDGNCENCDGWDGVSHRCECGNRRVSWEQDYDFSFENPTFRAVAY